MGSAGEETLVEKFSMPRKRIPYEVSNLHLFESVSIQDLEGL
jgi:hypothetical protein